MKPATSVSGGMRHFGGAVAWAIVLAGATAAAEPGGRLTAYVVGAPTAALRTGVAESFAGDGRVVYRPLAELLPEAVEDVAAELAKADEDLDEGDKAFSGMDLEPAKQRLVAAVERYRAWLPELTRRDHGAGKLQTAWLLLAKVYFFDGDTANARVALRHCLTLDAQLAFTKTVFPPQMKKLVLETRAQYDAAGGGTVNVETTPAGASVYVDGVARPAPAPQIVELPAGPHDLRLGLDGDAGQRPTGRRSHDRHSVAPTIGRVRSAARQLGSGIDSGSQLAGAATSRASATRCAWQVSISTCDFLANSASTVSVARARAASKLTSGSSRMSGSGSDASQYWRT
ncbi:MAG: hypothetical protein JWM53_3240 [bacterium]|nr:hypothetical protein [bacterium]